MSIQNTLENLSMMETERVRLRAEQKKLREELQNRIQNLSGESKQDELDELTALNSQIERLTNLQVELMQLKQKTIKDLQSDGSEPQQKSGLNKNIDVKKMMTETVKAGKNLDHIAANRNGGNKPKKKKGFFSRT